jgi:Ni/Co efflux regulator RcnB
MSFVTNKLLKKGILLMKMSKILFALLLASPIATTISSEARPRSDERSERERRDRDERERRDRITWERGDRITWERRDPGVRYPGNRYPGNRYPGNRYPGNRYPGYRGPGYTDSYYGEASCSPDVKQKNVGILESTVNGLAVTPEFANAEVFRSSVADIQSQTDMEARIAAYCDLVGVDSRSANEVAEFIGARDLAPYVEVARSKLGLTQEQADVLVRSLSQNLLSGVND